MKKISAKQQQILEYISSYSLEHGYPPSVREIGAEMGLRSPSTVHAHLKKLQEAGYLEPNEHKSRALTPVSGPSMVPRVPILGSAACGEPIYKPGDGTEFVTVAASITRCAFAAIR
jgi:repressor LexA